MYPCNNARLRVSTHQINKRSGTLPHSRVHDFRFSSNLPLTLLTSNLTLATLALLLMEKEPQVRSTLATSDWIFDPGPERFERQQKVSRHKKIVMSDPIIPGENYNDDDG